MGRQHLYDMYVTRYTTLPGIMKWYEKQPLLLESTVDQQLPEFAFSNKGACLEDVLLPGGLLRGFYYLEPSRLTCKSILVYFQTHKLLLSRVLHRFGEGYHVYHA